jgi:hypothetical protein
MTRSREQRAAAYAQRRIDKRKRAAPARKAKRAASRETAFGYELAMLANGAPLADVVASACGASDGGREHAARWRVLLNEIPQRAHRRRVFGHFLRTFNGCRPHGSMWRVVDVEGFVGKRYELGWRDVVDDATGEVKGRKRGRKHVPKARAGGLAVKEGRSPRTLDRDRELMRAGKLIGSQQPPRIDPQTGEPPADAYWPAGDDPQHPYAQHWLILPPSHEMIQRWLAYPPPEHPKRPALSPSAARKARRTRALPFELAEGDVPF